MIFPKGVGSLTSIMKNIPSLLALLLSTPLTLYCQSATDTVPKPKTTILQEATVTGQTPPVQRKKDRTIINVEASPTNTGSTVLEVLERSPGVTVDRNGGISLNGKPGVLVLIDDKPTYLNGDDLNNLLSSMNAAQVSKIELISNPPASYDAAGNAGIINIAGQRKTKQCRFQWQHHDGLRAGRIPQDQQQPAYSIYKKGAINTFFNYSINDVGYLSNLYAYRQYYDENKNVTAILQQPSYFTGTVLNNTARTGLDYSPSANTTLGLQLTGMSDTPGGQQYRPRQLALDPAGNIDSSVLNQDHSPSTLLRTAPSTSTLARPSQKTPSCGWTSIICTTRCWGDWISDNQSLQPGGYDSVFTSSIPTTIDIHSGKLDAQTATSGGLTLLAGVKLSSSHTDNAATYQDLVGQQWVIDETRSNHFVYQENIQAAYASIEDKYHKLSFQAGLRYEHTGYTANQSGNSVQKDSTVSRNYGSFSPKRLVFPGPSTPCKVSRLQWAGDWTDRRSNL